MLYGRQLDAGQLAVWGMSLSDVEEDIIEVWDCNEQTFKIFCAMDSQWRVGVSGATGLDYSALPVVWDAFNVKKKKRAESLALLRVMESAALDQMAENKEDG